MAIPGVRVAGGNRRAAARRRRHRQQSADRRRAQAVRRRGDRRQHLHAGAEARRDRLRAHRRHAASQFSGQVDRRPPAREPRTARRADRARARRHQRRKLRAIGGSGATSAKPRPAAWPSSSRATACPRRSTRSAERTQIVEQVQREPVDEIRIKGLERSNAAVLAGLVQTKPGEPLTEEKLAADLRRIYGRGDFESVDYNISQEPGKRVLDDRGAGKDVGPRLPAVRARPRHRLQRQRRLQRRS